MPQETIYLKIEQDVQLHQKRVLLKDVAKIYGISQKLVQDIGKIELLFVKEEKDCTYCFSILKIISLIQKQYPNLTIENLGETDFLVHYVEKKKENLIWEWIKVAFVALSIFFGAAFTIMTFNTDVSVSDVFDHIYQLVMGKEKTAGSVLEIAYAIGIPIGTLVFYNHFSLKKRREDPTPIQIQMRTYEQDQNKAMIKEASREGKTIDIQ